MSKQSRENMNLTLLDKIIRTTNISNTKIKFNNNGSNVTYKPILERGNIVECEFVGIGSELDDTHYAIVWSAPSDNENLNVIPLTSKPKDESNCIFGIGKIPNFITLSPEGEYVNKDSYVYLNKMMEVSRKRIKLFFQKDINGNMVQECKKGNTINLPIIIHKDQLNRIKEGIRLFYLNDGECLVNLICSQHVSFFCETNYDVEIYKSGHRLLEKHSVNHNEDFVDIEFGIYGKLYSIKMRKMSEENWKVFKSEEHLKLYDKVKKGSNFIDRRKNIIHSLFSCNEEKVKEAQNIIQDIFKTS